MLFQFLDLVLRDGCIHTSYGTYLSMSDSISGATARLEAILGKIRYGYRTDGIIRVLMPLLENHWIQIYPVLSYI